MRIISIVEATTLNAVARTTLEFFRTARDLSAGGLHPPLEGSIITFDREQGLPSEFVLATRSAGIEIDIIPERRRFDLSVISAMKKIVEQRRPEIVMTNSVKSHFLFWRSRLWRQHAWVAHHHGYTNTDRKMRLYNRFDRWSLPKAHRIITVCSPFAQELCTVAGVPLDRISVQHNPIRVPARPDPIRVDALRENLAIGPGERVILSVGRLSQEKAHTNLIDAFRYFQQSAANQKSKLVIVGDGPERGRLESQAKTFGLSQQIIFAGQTSEVLPYYSMADLFVLPSDSEGSPNVLLEAMAAEVPVVATAVGGVPEIVEHEHSALLVPARDPKSMAAAMIRLQADEELSHRLTTNAFARVQARHTPENYVRSLAKIFQELCPN